MTPFLHVQGVFPQSGQTRGRSETERTALSLEGDVRSSAGAHGALICWRPRGAHLLAPLDAHLLAPTGRSSAGADSPPSEGSAVAVLRVDIAAVGSGDWRLTLNRERTSRFAELLAGPGGEDRAERRRERTVPGQPHAGLALAGPLASTGWEDSCAYSTSQ